MLDINIIRPLLNIISDITLKGLVEFRPHKIQSTHNVWSWSKLYGYSKLHVKKSSSLIR